jgi:hypothetical protein
MLHGLLRYGGLKVYKEGKSSVSGRDQFSGFVIAAMNSCCPSLSAAEWTCLAVIQ